MAFEKEKARRFLLGIASEAEEEEIGVRIIEDEQFAYDLSMAESELIEEYLEDSLSETERDLFQKHFLVNDHRREQVNEIALLKKYSSGAKPVYDPKSKRVWWPFRFDIRPLTAAFGVLMAGLAGFAVWQLFIRDNASPLERQYAELNLADLSDVGNFRSYPVVELTPGNYRDTGGSPVIRLSGSGESILFRALLSFTPEADVTFRVEFIQNGSTKFTIKKASIFKDGNVNEARFLLPRSQVEQGDYQVRLTRNGGTDSPIIYSFAAE